LRLEEKANSLGLSDKVVFTGRISESEKVAHYNLADAYVMPSTGEGFGIVLIEAAACGVPVVGSRVDGSREALLDGRLGHLVDPTQPLITGDGLPLKAVNGRARHRCCLTIDMSTRSERFKADAQRTGSARPKATGKATTMEIVMMTKVARTVIIMPWSRAGSIPGTASQLNPMNRCPFAGHRRKA
jgi:hypothetical protein